MNATPYDRLAELRSEVLAIEAAMQQAARDALLVHRRAGQPVVTWQDGRVVLIPVSEIADHDSSVS